MCEIEVFKDIPGYEGLYQVSNWGNVKSLNYRHTGREKVLNLYYHKGYLKVCIYKDGAKEDWLIHRLVAMAFIPIPERLKDYDINELDVHHIDGDKKNNIDNLVWLTKEEHRRLHAESEETKTKQSVAKKGKKLSEETKAKMSVALKGHDVSEATRAKIAAAHKGIYNTVCSKPVEAYDNNGNLVFRFPSTMEAGRNGFNSKDISSCCRGKRKRHKGLYWRFALK